MHYVELDVSHEEQPLGHYAISQSQKIDGKRSHVACPYCRCPMIELMGLVGISRVSTNKPGRVYLDILPSHYKAYACVPCKGEFCIDSAQSIFVDTP